MSRPSSPERPALEGLPEESARGSRLLGTGDRRGLAVSTASTVIVLAALVVLFLLAPGSREVRHTFFNPTDMWRALVGDPAKGYYSVGEAIWLNIRMFVVAEIGILILALAVAVIRQSTGPALLPLRVVSTVYVDVCRGVPLILLIFAIGFGAPALSLRFISSQSAAVYGVAALVGVLGSIEANKAAELFSDTERTVVTALGKRFPALGPKHCGWRGCGRRSGLTRCCA